MHTATYCDIGPFDSFGVISFKTTARIRDVLQRMEHWGARRNVEIHYHPLLKSIAPNQTRAESDEKTFLANSQAFVSVGGDGTFLSAAHMCLSQHKPVVGVNLGGLGFLTGIAVENLESDLDNIRIGQCSAHNRKILNATLVRNGKPAGTMSALNDVFINRVDMPKLASMSVWHGDEFVNEFQSDGIIVATPAGSTAYSLAAGGPILSPDMDAFLINPICPHSLAERPLILPSTSSIRILINPRNPALLLSADGLESERLHAGDIVTIEYDGTNQACLIQLAESGFFESLRSKLGWGRETMKRDRSENDS